MHDHLPHSRGNGAQFDLAEQIPGFRQQLAETFPSQLTDEDHAELVGLLATLARLIGEE